MDFFLIILTILFVILSIGYGYIMYVTVNKRKDEIVGQFFSLSPLSIFFMIVELFLLYVAIYNILLSDDMIIKIFSSIVALCFSVIFYCYATLAILPDYIKHGNTIMNLKDIKKVYPTEKKFYVRLVIKTNSKKKTLILSNKAFEKCKHYFKGKTA